MTPREYVLQGLAAHFPKHRFSPESLSIKHRGRFANALVFRYRDGTHDLTIKDFTHCPFPIGATFGRFCIQREFSTMQRLNGLSGVTPGVYRLGPLTVAYDYIHGEPLINFSMVDKTLPASFFSTLETLIEQMHTRGVAHLDLRNMGNILRGDDGHPYIIDFQSSVPLRLVPKPMRELLRSTDKSGVYKAWSRFCAEPLPSDKQQFLDEFNRIRKFWILRGYPFRRLWARIRQKRPVG